MQLKTVVAICTATSVLVALILLPPILNSRRGLSANDALWIGLAFAGIGILIGLVITSRRTPRAP